MFLHWILWTHWFILPVLLTSWECSAFFLTTLWWDKKVERKMRKKNTNTHTRTQIIIIKKGGWGVSGCNWNRACACACIVSGRRISNEMVHHQPSRLVNKVLWSPLSCQGVITPFRWHTVSRLLFGTQKGPCAWSRESCSRWLPVINKIENRNFKSFLPSWNPLERWTATRNSSHPSLFWWQRAMHLSEKTFENLNGTGSKWGLGEARI